MILCVATRTVCASWRRTGNALPFKSGLKPLHSDERGMAMVYAMLALFLLVATATAFLISVNIGTKTVGRNVRTSQSLNIAEAGIAEATQRIRFGDIPDTGNPRMVAQIFLAQSGSLPALGADSIALPTAQPVGDWLNYSLDRRDSRVLTVKYKTDAAQTQIYRYDPTKSPMVQTQSGVPIFEVTSTGRKGNDRTKVVTEVFVQPVVADIKAALAADVNIRFTGNSAVCGYNHLGSTPAGTKDRGPCLGYETGSGHLPGAWTTGTTTQQGSSEQYGSPVAIAENQVGFYAGPWAVLRMSQAEFFSWIGDPISSEPSPPKGIFYLDNNSTSQDKSGSFAFHGSDGEGLLYVDGDLTLNGNVTFRGVIYAEGDIKVNGGAWILGAMIAKGKTEIKHANGSACVLFSSEAVQQNISKYGGVVRTLSWRENP